MSSNSSMCDTENELTSHPIRQSKLFILVCIISSMRHLLKKESNRQHQLDFFSNDTWPLRNSTAWPSRPVHSSAPSWRLPALLRCWVCQRWQSTTRLLSSWNKKCSKVWTHSQVWRSTNFHCKILRSSMPLIRISSLSSPRTKLKSSFQSRERMPSAEHSTHTLTRSSRTSRSDPSRIKTFVWSRWDMLSTSLG